MIDLLLSFCLSLLVIVLQVVVPGVGLCSLLDKKITWTFIDAFFVGLLWNVLVILLVVPFLGDVFEISLIVKFLSVLLIILILIRFFYKKNAELENNIINALKKSITINHLLLAFLVTGITILFVSTHNLGFDDIAHLQYLNDAVAGKPYPVFRVVVGEWQAARYPFFGLMIGQLGQGFSGSALFLYYILSLAIFVAFVLKIYEIFLVGNINKSTAFAFTLLISAMMMVVGFDNYFNFGLYPLQQAKLLFILGLVYFFIGWGVQKNKVYFFIGVGLIYFSVLYHLNLLLLYLAFLPVALLFIYFYFSDKKKWILYSCFFLIPALVSMPSALSTEHGFLHFEKKIKSVSTGPKVPAVKKLSRADILLLKAKKILLWVKEGRYRSKYLSRVFSLDVLAVPLLIFIILQVLVLSQLTLFALMLASLVFLQQVITTIPKQFVSSTLRSGTVWMLYDIVKSGVIKESLSSRVVTDAYTALYLKLLGLKNVEVVKSREAIFSFSPPFSTNGINYIAASKSMSKNDLFLLNGRYWKLKAAKNWRENNLNSTKLGNHSGEISDLDSLINNLSQYYDKGNIQHLNKVAKAGLEAIKLHIDAPMLLRQPKPKQGKVDDYQVIIDDFLVGSVYTYRHFSIVKLFDLKVGDSIQFDCRGNGDAEYLGTLVGEETGLKVAGKGMRGNKIEFEIIKPIEEATLLFKMDFGHFGELGMMGSVHISKN